MLDVMPKNKMSFLEAKDMPCLEVEVMPDNAAYQKLKKCQMMPCSEAEATPEDAVFRKKIYAKWFLIKLCQMVPSLEIEPISVVMQDGARLEVGVISEAMPKFVPDVPYLSY